MNQILAQRSAPYDCVFVGEKKVVMIPPRWLGGRQSASADLCASPEAGAFSAGANARIGAAAFAAVMQCIEFPAEKIQTVHVTATIEYIGANDIPRFGLFTGLKKIWEVNGIRVQERLAPATDWKGLSAKCSELGLFDVSERRDKLVDTILSIGRMTELADLEKVLEAFKSRRFSFSFGFQTAIGINRIGVGLAAKASAGLTSSACSVIAGRLISLKVVSEEVVAVEDMSQPAAVISAPAAVLVEPVSSPYVGNSHSKELHRSNCRSLGSMKPENRKPFDSVGEALEQGYVVCWRCVGRPKELQGRWVGGIMGLRTAEDILRSSRRR